MDLNIDESYYRLNEVLQIMETMSGKAPRRVWIWRKIHLQGLLNYWFWAVASCRTNRMAATELAQRISDLSQTLDVTYDQDLNSRGISAAVATYGHMRVCLRFCSSLADNAFQSSVTEEAAEALVKYRVDNGAWAKNLIDARNKITAHGDDARKMVTSLGSWGTSGDASFTLIDLWTLGPAGASIHLRPDEEIVAMYKYIKGLVPLLEDCWGISS